MPQHVRLSNGAALDIPDGTPQDEIKSRVNTAETMIRLGVPNILKNLKTQSDVVQGAAGAAGRVAGAGVDLIPPVGIADMGISGLNAAKSAISGSNPSLRSVPDIPTISGAATSAIGAPPLSSDAPALQRYGESALTGALSPGSKIMSVLRMLGSTALGDVGGSTAQRLGGPYWEKAGRFIGSLVGGMPDKTVTEPSRAVVQKVFSGKQAPQVADQASLLDLQPSFGTLANMPGRRLEKALGSFPIVGIPIGAAQARIVEGIREARDRTAKDINQGPLPTTFDPSSIGSALITHARERSAAIKADASQRFEDLNSQVGADTLVDAAPVARAIQALKQRSNVSPDQIDQLNNRLNYLNSMTYGQPYYNGPVFGHNIQPLGSITLGQLSKFRSELGADLQSMPALDTVSQGQVRDAITSTIRPYYVRRGLGDQFDQANQNYAQNIGPGTPTAALDAVGGRPVPGKPGIYEGGMDEKQAHNFIASNLQSPSSLEPFVYPGSPYWRAAVSQFVGSLGNAKQGSDFRPDTFSTQAKGISDEVLSQLTQGATGGATDAFAKLRAAQGVGAESTVPVHRHGLSDAVGTLGAVALAQTHLGDWFRHMGLPPELAIPAFAGAGYGLESKTMTDTMAGRGPGPTPLTDALYQGIPYAAASLNLDNPDDPNRYLNAQPSPPQKPGFTLLDQLISQANAQPPPPPAPASTAYSP